MFLNWEREISNIILYDPEIMEPFEKAMKHAEGHPDQIVAGWAIVAVLFAKNYGRTAEEKRVLIHLCQLICDGEWPAVGNAQAAVEEYEESFRRSARRSVQAALDRWWKR